MVNRTTYKVVSLGDIDDIPFHNKNRASFSISYQSSSREYNIQVEFNYKYSPHVTVYRFNSKSSEMYKSVVEAVESQKTWYSWTYGAAYAIVWGLSSAIIGLSSYSIYNIYMGEKLNIADAGVLVLAVSGVFGLVVRLLLFSPMAFDLGEEAERQAALSGMRKWVFGTFLTGVALALIAAVFRALLR
jgi:hypothetical protein